MALIDPYCTIVEADAFLDTSSSWNAVSDSEKTTALFWGRTYLDSYYTCINWDDELVNDLYPDYPDNLKYANALLADEYIKGNLFKVSATGNKEIVKKRVKAGDVESETTYRGEAGTDSGVGIDPFPEVTSLLAEWCSANIDSGLGNIRLVRT